MGPLPGTYGRGRTGSSDKVIVLVTQFCFHKRDASPGSKNTRVGTVQARVRGQEERHLNFKTCDRNLMVALKHAGARHCCIEPSSDDSALYDPAHRMPVS